MLREILVCVKSLLHQLRSMRLACWGGLGEESITVVSNINAAPSHSPKMPGLLAGLWLSPVTVGNITTANISLNVV